MTRGTTYWLALLLLALVAIGGAILAVFVLSWLAFHEMAGTPVEWRSAVVMLSIGAALIVAASVGMTHLILRRRTV